MKEYQLFIGLNDRQELVQKRETERYIAVLQDVCRSYRTAFSYHLINGGYFHENGDYTTEQTLVLTLLDTDPALVKEIARDLCTFFNQESVMLTVGDREVEFIGPLELWN